MRYIKLLIFTLLLVQECFSQDKHEIISKISLLTPLLKDTRSGISGVSVSEDALFSGLQKIDWNYESPNTYENIYYNLKDDTLDYRIFLIIAKSAGNSAKNTSDSFYLLKGYYKLLFVNLAITNGKITNQIQDRLKYEYTNIFRNLLALRSAKSFHNYEEFKSCATLSIKYANELLNSLSFRLKLSNLQRSSLYQLIGETVYESSFLTEKDSSVINLVLRYLSSSIIEDKTNTFSIDKRARINKNILNNYTAAIIDYSKWVELTQQDNTRKIKEFQRSKYFQSTTHAKGFLVTNPTFPRIVELIVCYILIEDYTNVLLWCNKAIISMSEYKTYNLGIDDLINEHEGKIHFYKASAYHFQKQNLLACKELTLAFNLGFNYESCQELRRDIKCK